MESHYLRIPKEVCMIQDLTTFDFTKSA